MFSSKTLHCILAILFIFHAESYAAEATREKKVGTCSSYQVLKISFDSENNPSFFIADSIDEEAELWHQDASSLGLYLTSDQKLLDDNSIAFDPRSKDMVYDMFEMSGYVSIPVETRKCLVIRTLALVAEKATIIDGDTRIVLYPKCGKVPFANICIEAIDKSRPMHFQGILPLYGNSSHKLCHSIKNFPFCGLACHTVNGIKMVELPSVENSTFKMTNAKISFIKDVQ